LPELLSPDEPELDTPEVPDEPELDAPELLALPELLSPDEPELDAPDELDVPDGDVSDEPFAFPVLSGPDGAEGPDGAAGPALNGPMSRTEQSTGPHISERAAGPESVMAATPPRAAIAVVASQPTRMGVFMHVPCRCDR
jgi:hypothetical protein